MEIHTYGGHCFISQIFTNMNHSKNSAGNLLPMTVTEGVTVNVLPNAQHEFLMTTKQVANGYGISEYTLRRHKMEQSAELVDNKHFVSAVQILNGEQMGALKMPHNATFWTKRGIVRLGFFIKSERAKLFRDWAEELIIKVDELSQQEVALVPTKMLPDKRKHNRLTPERIIDILADVCKVEDKELRISLTNKIVGGQE